MAMYTSGNDADDDIAGDEVNFYQPLSTDASYGADWGTQIYSLGIDYFNILYGTVGGLNPGVAIGYDRYGRMQFGAKVAYAVTPAWTVGAAVTASWTAKEVDTDSTLSTAAGLTPSAGADGDERYLGTEVNLSTTYRFAPGVAFDLATGYLFAGDALAHAGTAAFPSPGIGADDPNNVFIATSRVRFSF
jgi:hypothetical protein